MRNCQNAKQLAAAAPRIHRRARTAFEELLGRIRADHEYPADREQAVAGLAYGIFAGSVTNDPEGMVRAVERLSQVVAYAAVMAAYPPPLPPRPPYPRLDDYTAREGADTDA